MSREGPISESIKGDLERESRTAGTSPARKSEREKRLGAKKLKSCPKLVRRVRQSQIRNENGSEEERKIPFIRDVHTRRGRGWPKSRHS